MGFDRSRFARDRNDAHLHTQLLRQWLRRLSIFWVFDEKES